MKVTRSVVTGVAMAIVLMGATGVALASTQVSGPSSHQLQISFPSADGLVNGSDVLIAGSKIGYVSDVEPTQTDSALVTVSIEDAHWPLHQGLRADIRPKSLLGEKYVDLHDGSQGAPAYDLSKTLQAGPNAAPVELDQFINSLDAPTRSAVRVLLDDLGAGVAAKGYDL